MQLIGPGAVVSIFFILHYGHTGGFPAAVAAKQMLAVGPQRYTKEIIPHRDPENTSAFAAHPFMTSGVPVEHNEQSGHRQYCRQHSKVF